MTALTIYVPRINDELCDFTALAGIWTQVIEAGDSAEVTFDFSHCYFLRPNAVVFLGGLAHVIHSRGGSARFLTGTMQQAVQMNLLQNGFAHAMGAGSPPWQGNSIPYREYVEPDKSGVIHKNGVIQLLTDDWLGRGWISVSPNLANEIVGRMWEIFANAFEHGNSPVGIYCCGQYLKKRRELLLAVADFGVGIPSNVRIFGGQPDMDAQATMRWALTSGTSTSRRSGPSGVGLNLLREFVKATHGRLAIFSHDGYASIDGSGETYQNLPAFFEGTLVQVTLRCDDTYYSMSNEIDSAPYF